MSERWSWLAGAAGAALYGVIAWLQHSLDRRIYYADVGESLEPVVRLLNDGVFVPHANSFLWLSSVNEALHLGPLPTLLLAVPGLFSRDLGLLYGYMSLFAAAGLLLLFLLCRRVFTSPLAIAATMSIYAVALGLAHDFIYAVHTSLMPPFMVGFLLLLWRIADRGPGWAVVAAWAVYGCIVQTHMMAAPAILGLAVVAPPRSRRLLGLHAAGAALVLLMHAHLVEEIWTLREAIFGGHYGTEAPSNPLSVRFASLVSNIGWELSHVFGTAGWLVGLPAAAAFLVAAVRPAGAAGRFALGWVALILPQLTIALAAMAAQGESFLAHYFYSAIPAVAFACGAAVERLGELGRRERVASVALTGVLIAGALGDLRWEIHAPWSEGPSDAYYDFMRLEPQVEIGQRIAELVRHEGLADVRLWAFVYDDAEAMAACRPSWEGYETYQPLVGYLAPELGPRLSAEGRRTVLAEVFPRSVEPARLPVALTTGRGEPIADFVAGRARVRVSLADEVTRCSIWRLR